MNPWVWPDGPGCGKEWEFDWKFEPTTTCPRCGRKWKIAYDFWLDEVAPDPKLKKLYQRLAAVMEMLQDEGVRAYATQSRPGRYRR